MIPAGLDETRDFQSGKFRTPKLALLGYFVVFSLLILLFFPFPVARVELSPEELRSRLNNLFESPSAGGRNDVPVPILQRSSEEQQKILKVSELFCLLPLVVSLAPE